MAISNVILSEGWIGDNAKDYEGINLPSGVTADQIGTGKGKYYAYQRTYTDGRKVVEWLKRGEGGGEGGQGDAVTARSEQVVPAIKVEWDKEQAAGPKTVPINGVPHQATTDANGNTVYAPVQTTAGPATAGTPRTPEQQRADTANATSAEAKARAEQAEEAERAAHVAAGHGNVTDVQWSAELARREAAERANGNQEAANKLAQEKLAFDRERAIATEQRQAAADERAERTANQPDRKVTEHTINGKRYTTVTTVPKEGGQAVIKNYGPDGAEVGELPTETKPGDYQPLPTGVPTYIPDFAQSDLGLGARRRQLDGLIAAGTITKEQAASAITTDLGLAEVAGKNAGAIVNIQEGARRADLDARGQDVTDASSRRSFASSTFNQAAQSLIPTGAKFIPGKGSAEAAAAGFLGMLGIARDHATASGAPATLAPYDANKYPALGAYGQAGIPGLPGGPPLSTQWTFPNTPGGNGGRPPWMPPAPPAGMAPGSSPVGMAPPAAVAPAAANAFDMGPNGLPVPRVRTPASATGYGAQPSGMMAPPPPVPQANMPPGPGASLYARAGQAANYDPFGDTDLQDLWARAGFDMDLFPAAFGG